MKQKNLQYFGWNTQARIFHRTALEFPSTKSFERLKPSVFNEPVRDHTNLNLFCSFTKKSVGSETFKTNSEIPRNTNLSLLKFDEPSFAHH